MGIPKFFRFISERWPLILEQIESQDIQEFDNLYLDMNSILHTCTHSNDGTITKLTEEQMYGSIFKYIEHLFEIIKPQKVFYMAIDGVAPRAKMNQQRARRFRTAYEAEINLNKAIEQGLDVPKDDPFDSNSITPGTEFMANLTQNLKYFIHKKITEDANWASVEVVLSGHEVPGEGEHKIMEYIRTMKNLPDYDVNLRHCIYGLDADLIMLSLVTHEPHFALLREEVTFGPASKSKSSDLHDQTFFLLHISLLREYFSLEFQELDNDLPFEYNFEKILDDFILIMYFVGNDFLPNLPDLFINKGGFPLLINNFKTSLRYMDGYINDNGKINLERLAIWLKYLSTYELENFEQDDVDVDWFNQKLHDISITGEKRREKLGKLIISKDEKKIIGFIKPWLMELINFNYLELSNLETLAPERLTLNLNSQCQNDFIRKNFTFLKRTALELGLLIVHSISDDTYVLKFDLDGLNPSATQEEHLDMVNDIKKTFKSFQQADVFESDEAVDNSKNLYNTKFMEWKDHYYKQKLGFSIHDKSEIVELTKHYVEGLQWVLFYYYNGCKSWSWYYKYHYAPRISDISIGLQELIDNNETISFEMSKPFKPFEQLMAVLPARSKKLVPLEYRTLMTDPQSPIINFYPHEVDIDLNGKTASWEAVVLLDFVDAHKLVDILKPIEQKLTAKEQMRNSFGNNIQFLQNPQNDSIYPSPLPGIFKEIEHDHCFERPFILPEVKAEMNLNLRDGAKLGKASLAGFPTLLTLNFDFKLILNETKVFQNASRSESMVLNIHNSWDNYLTKQLGERFLGDIVYTRWPYLRESKLLEISDEDFKYEFLNGKKITTQLEPSEQKSVKQTLTDLSFHYMKTKAVCIKPKALIKVQHVTGLIRDAHGGMEKAFSNVVETYPIDLMVESVVNEDPRYKPRPPLAIDQEFPVNSQAIFLGAFGYGATCLIAGYSPDKTKLNIKVSKINSQNEVLIGKQRVEIEKQQIEYYPSFEVAKKVGVPPLFLSQLTSGFLVEDNLKPRQSRKLNLGLELKFDAKRLKVLGYTKKTTNYWQYSSLAIELIREYKRKFPTILNTLMKTRGKAIPQLSGLGINQDELNSLKSWLTEVKLSLVKVSLESESLTKFSFEAIENEVIRLIQSGELEKFSNKDIKGVPKEAIINPNESYQLLKTQSFSLGDRVVYVQKFGKLPFLAKGTVVSISASGTKTQLGVIFDYPILSGGTFSGKLKTNRGATVESTFVLNLTDRQLIYHSKASRNKPVLNHQVVMKKKLASLLTQSNMSHNHKNEILNLINSNIKPEDINTSGDTNSNAIKQIYGQIYNSIMSEGIAPVVPGIPLPPQFQKVSKAESKTTPTNKLQLKTNNNVNAVRKHNTRHDGKGRAEVKDK